MPKVTMLIGLPGSGKTEYLSAPRRRGEPVFDDFHANAIGNSHAFDNSRNRKPLKAALAARKDCFIADIEFCKSSQLAEVVGGINRLAAELAILVTIDRLFFANDPVACEANVRVRNRPTLAAELANIARLTREYRIPPDAQVLPVWRSAR